MLALLSLLTLLGNESHENYAKRLSAFLYVEGGLRRATVLHSESQKEAAGSFHLAINAPLTFNSLQMAIENVDYRDPNTLVVILDEEMSAEFVLRNTLRNHDTLYVFFSNDEDAAKKRFAEFWQHRVIAVFAVIGNWESYSLYGFEPSPEDVVLVERKVIAPVGVFDCHGSRTNVSVVNLPPSVLLNPKNDMTVEGTEGQLMLEVAKKFKLEPHFAVPRDGELWGWIHPKPVGVAGEVTSGYSDFGFGIMAITDSRVKAMDQLTGYNMMECVTWAVPKGAGPATAPWIAMLTTEFSLNTWRAMAGSSFGIVLASLLVDRMRFGPTLFRIFASSIGSPVFMPTKSSARVLILTWVWVSFVLATAYTASMGSKLAVPPTNPDINTIQDLYDSDLDIYALRNSIRLMQADDSRIQEIASRTIVTTETVSQGFHRIVTNRDTAFMRQGTTFRYHAIIDPSSQEGVHIMKDCSFQYYSAIALEKWSPYYLGTSQVMRRLYDAGILELWGSRLMPEFPPLPTPPKALSFGHLLGAFGVLAGGLVFGLVAFIVELCFKGGSALKEKVRAMLHLNSDRVQKFSYPKKRKL